MSKSKSLRQEAQRHPSQDLDPEDEAAPHQDQSSSEDESGDDYDGREHYQSVGKSILRQSELLRLPSKYSSSAVTRAALQEEDDDDDPFAPVDEEEDTDPFAVVDRDGGHISGASDEDENDIKGDLTKDLKRVSVDEGLGADEDDEMDEQYATDSTSEASDDEGIDEDAEVGSQTSASSTASSPAPSRSATSRDKLKHLNINEASSVAASLSAAANADVKKGLAVQRQQSAYDRLLDARIKMQKGLTASNDLSTHSISGDEAQEAIRKAEAAAHSLWSTIESIRATVQSTKEPGSVAIKATRKRPFVATSADSLSSIWNQSQSMEESSMPDRRTILNKWSASTRVAAPTAVSETQLTSVLDTYTASEAAKLAPQPAVSGDSLAYADDSFYQSLLRDLIASRTQSSASAGGSSFLPTKLHPSGSSKKLVDTRASKGRKIRYTVQEKLQNFMASEDRTTWSEAARLEFFASLFGQRLLDETHANAINGDAVIEAQEAGLRLFRGQ